MSSSIPPAASRPPLFTPAFLTMCGFTFTVFLSAFQLFPAAPFRIRDLGGSPFQSGLFIGLLTFASATSAPFTGAIGDRIGRRRTLLLSSSIIALCSVGYAVVPRVEWMLALVAVHGLFWSGLLSASSAHMTSLLPPVRRTEGLGYWGVSTVLAIAVAPPLGFWIMRHGWVWLCVSCLTLNLVMGAIAWRLQEPPHEAHAPEGSGLVEWRVMAVALSLFLYTFGYGAAQSFSALYAESAGIVPKSLFMSVQAVAIIFTRPMAGLLADRLGPRRVFGPCVTLIVIGFALMSLPPTFGRMATAAAIFGAGFGTAYPVFVAHVMQDVHPRRRGAAFGAILTAFDTGIGTGSTVSGWVVQHAGYGVAFGVCAGVAALSLPYFVAVDRWFRRREPVS